MAVGGDKSLRAPSIPSFKFIASPFFLEDDALPVSVLVDLVTVTFDLETDALYCPWGEQPSYQFGCFYRMSFSTYRPTPVRRIT